MLIIFELSHVSEIQEGEAVAQQPPISTFGWKLRKGAIELQFVGNVA
ncbi:MULTISPECIES: hypothetical protein [unclassified Microcoleus]|nr:MULTISPECIES: hypothetical protein [unclassified Microcoleus]MCC3431132.1 hypothetical protein [Microcoleus sp. PH2017_04_SCI_O_A]MCC3440711.1 hypothetical protein [Microcoleus sp. PH2017_03_ELD_O_A]MCC3502211.1 hypothetical protein [Microcoleus sp. PH2017_19_SFW_U_A]MCC3411453.1 hypothetical protein [Microcoleus sp. PH2017_02_FOX_O_A]MCC3436577.1 hypothetical protein [Microcoleus sp. PH2017_05_CCC_O_A]